MEENEKALIEQIEQILTDHLGAVNDLMMAPIRAGMSSREMPSFVAKVIEGYLSKAMTARTIAQYQTSVTRRGT